MSELPPGWSLAELGDVISGFETGRNLMAASTAAAPGAVGVLKISAVTWGNFRPNENKALLPGDAPFPHETVKAGDLLISRANTTELVGAPVLVDKNHEHLMLPDKILRICYDSKFIDPRFLLQAIRTRTARAHIEREATGTSDSMRNLSQPKLRGIPLRLAPLPEQKRIATKLDTLFARTNACRERLDRVPAVLKRFRQSVLAAATSGELTKEWRRSNPDTTPVSLAACEPPPESTELPATWRWVSVGTAAWKVADGVHKKPDYVASGIPFITVRNLTAGSGIDFSDTSFITESDHREFSKRTLPEKGDILISKDGTLGVVRLIEDSRVFNIFVSVALIKLRDKQMGPYIRLALEAPILQKQMVGVGTGLLHIHLRDLREDVLPLPPIQEQKEIVRRVSELLSLADQLAQRHQTVKAKVATLTPSLLAKAFRGELVPQDPIDEPASVLLERLQAERVTAGQSPSRRSPRTTSEKHSKSSHSSSTPTSKRDCSPQAAPTRPRRPPSPEPDPEDPPAPYRRPLEAYTTDEMMSHFRAASRASGEMTEEGLFRLVLARLGFERLGNKVTPILKGHLKAAIGRGIIERDGFFVRGKTPTIRHYERSTLVEALTSVMRKNHPYEREEVIQSLAVHLGYSSVSDVMRDTMKSVFNSAIRQGVLIREGSTIRRAD